MFFVEGHSNAPDLEVQKLTNCMQNCAASKNYIRQQLKRHGLFS